MNDVTYQKTLVGMTVEKLGKKDDEELKRLGQSRQALIFGNALVSAGGTFEFSTECKKFGYSTIFQAMAGELHEQGASPMVKAHNAEEYEQTYRNGYSMLNAKLLNEWDAIVVYAVPRRVNDKSIQVITLDGDLVVNDDGQTAAEVHALREKNRTSGQMTSSAKKLTRSIGQQKALMVLNGIVENIEKMVAIPRGSRMEELTENS